MVNEPESKMTDEKRYEEVEANQVLDKGVPTDYYVQITGKGDDARIQIFYTDINTKEVKRGSSFRIMDAAEWGAYGHRFYGRVLKITQNTVTISHSYYGSGRGPNKVLKLAKFCSHNAQFDLAKARAHNDLESQNR